MANQISTVLTMAAVDTLFTSVAKKGVSLNLQLNKEAV